VSHTPIIVLHNHSNETPAAPYERQNGSHSDIGVAALRKQELLKELEDIRTERRKERERAAKQRRKMYRRSRLDHFSGDLFRLRNCGASYAEMARWLKHNRKVTVVPTTIMRYLARLSAFIKEAEDEE
jgi:hypothetical protein